MSPFQLAEIPPAERERVLADLFTKWKAGDVTLAGLVNAAGATDDASALRALKDAADRSRSGLVFVNDTYQVIVKKFMPLVPELGPMVHLSIKRRDRQPVRDWRELQQIKNELVGPECEGCELHPAESRLVDTANQYHLWVFATPEMSFPFGFFDGRVVSEHSIAGSVNRPFEKPGK